jgi:hypothetical protein
MTIDLTALATSFVEHANTLRSAPFVCSAKTALEGWFRAEIVPALEDMGIQPGSIDCRFTYPGTHEQGDLAVMMEGSLTAFEFMHFLPNKDSKKIKRFLGQLDRLQRVTDDGAARQGIAFVTFSGYSKHRIESLVNQFFGTGYPAGKS